MLKAFTVDVIDPCYEHNCEQLCLVDDNNIAVCACTNGYVLQGDRLTCGVTILYNNFALGVDSFNNKIYQVKQFLMKYQ